ncbi:hypothetical protein C0J52_19134, partial [Blattella germanica]
AFRYVSQCSNFLGNVKADNYKELVKNFLKSYQHMGCNMSLKFDILHSHLDVFPPNMGAMWREVSSGYCCHGENICRKISTENLLIIKCFFNERVQERNFENVSKNDFLPCISIFIFA